MSAIFAQRLTEPLVSIGEIYIPVPEKRRKGVSLQRTGAPSSGVWQFCFESTMWRSSGQKCAVRFVKWPSRKGGEKIDSYPCCTTQISYVNQWKLNISQISIQNIIRFAMLQSWKH